MGCWFGKLISKFNKGIRFLLCVVDNFSKYAWVFPLKDKKGITITNSLQKILDESNCKPNNIWVDKGTEFYNRSMKSWLAKNAIIQYMASISNKVYIDKLDYMVNKHNNAYYRIIKMKPVDIKPSM